MTNTAAAPPATAPQASKGLLARMIGVFFSPRETFADVAARPRVLGALGIGIVIAVVALFALFSTEVGQQAWIDQQIKGSESFGRTLNDQQVAGMERIAPYIRYIIVVGYLVVIPIGVMIISGILLGIFNALLGGDATFKQVLAVVAHAGLILVLQSVFVAPLDYVRESLTSPTTLGAFVPFLEEKSFLSLLLGTIDVFQIWWLMTLSIGLAVLYKRRTGTIATSLLTVYGVIILAIAAVRAAFA